MPLVGPPVLLFCMLQCRLDMDSVAGWGHRNREWLKRVERDWGRSRKGKWEGFGWFDDIAPRWGHTILPFYMLLLYYSLNINIIFFFFFFFYSHILTSSLSWGLLTITSPWPADWSPWWWGKLGCPWEDHIAGWAHITGIRFFIEDLHVISGPHMIFEIWPLKMPSQRMISPLFRLLLCPRVSKSHLRATILQSTNSTLVTRLF